MGIDKLEELKKQYEKQFSDASTANETTDDDDNDKTSIESTDNFFEQYSMPPITPDASPNLSDEMSNLTSSPFPKEISNNIDLYPKENKKTNRKRVRQKPINSVPSVTNIPWKAILIVIGIIIVILLAINIWNARYEILNSVMDFIMALLPLVLILAGVIYLFKVLIKGKW